MHPEEGYTDDQKALLVLALLAWLHISLRLMVRLKPSQGKSKANQSLQRKSRIRTSYVSTRNCMFRFSPDNACQRTSPFSYYGV